MVYAIISHLIYWCLTKQHFTYTVITCIMADVAKCIRHCCTPITDYTQINCRNMVHSSNIPELYRYVQNISIVRLKQNFFQRLRIKFKFTYSESVFKRPELTSSDTRQGYYGSGTSPESPGPRNRPLKYVRRHFECWSFLYGCLCRMSRSSVENQVKSRHVQPD